MILNIWTFYHKWPKSTFVIDLGFVLTRNIVFIKFHVFKLIVISLYDYLYDMYTYIIN